MITIRRTYPLLVSLVVIDVELGRENHSSISATAIGRKLEPLDASEPD
jgi:hypothetical protein